MANNSETYSYSPLGDSNKRSKRTYIGTILFIVHLALTISLSVALVISYLTPHISPKTFGSLTIMGHFAPVLYMLVLICLLLWLIARSWKIAGVVALLLLPGIPYLSQFYNIAFMRKAEESAESTNRITVVTYNVRGFYNDEGKRVVKDFADYIAQSNSFNKEKMRAADVICLQEFALDADGVDIIDSLVKSSYKDMYINDVHESENVVLRTYSRYQIVDSGSIAGMGSGTSQWVDILRKEDTIRIFNNHFYTMSISDDDSDDIARGKILSDGERVKSIIERVADNSTVRTDHVDTLLKVVAATPYRHIVVGDFNDTPMSYVYNRMTEELTDLFTEKGSGFGYTYRPMWGWLRIDYVMYSEGFEPVNYKSDSEVVLSDHIPVSAQFDVKREL
jgi:endonuclease/exonuclease/phosphatase (EEP) superfamily protein YafD